MSGDFLSPMLDQLATHPRRDDLARLVQSVANGGALAEAAALGLTAADAETPLGNVLAVLEDGPKTERERLLLASLLARAIAMRAGSHEGAGERELSTSLLWLASRANANDAPRPSPSAPIEGEIVAAPRGPIATALLGMTGILLVVGLARLVGRFALAYRRPAEVKTTDRGVAVRARTEMLGKVLRDRETIVPLDGLVRATREVRYPGLPMYAGLIALALGSYLGMGLVVDGLRAASLSMAGFGALVLLVGLGIDLALTSVVPGATGKCRVLFVPRRGPTICIGAIDIATADRLLATVARR
jgi:hypothetical protein